MTRSLNEKRALHDDIVMCPFPQMESAKTPLAELWEQHRQNLINYAGIAIFVFGNKFADGKVVLSDGVEREFEIAQEIGLSLIPVGATGSMASNLWQRVTDDFETYYPANGPDVREEIKALGDDKLEPADLAQIIMSTVKKLKAA